MNMAYNLVKVSTSTLVLCLQCPLCNNLIHDATTISECLHSFCKVCIYEELDDGEGDCCPICDVNLGGSPLEKLRVDRQLNDICTKLFPGKLKKRKLTDIDLDEDAKPNKRRERTLASLGIGLLSCVNPGFVQRKTASVSRRSTMATMLTDTEESEEEKSMYIASDLDSDNEGIINIKDSILHTHKRYDSMSSTGKEKVVSIEKRIHEQGVVNEQTLEGKQVNIASSRRDIICGGEKAERKDYGKLQKGVHDKKNRRDAIGPMLLAKPEKTTQNHMIPIIGTMKSKKISYVPHASLVHEKIPPLLNSFRNVDQEVSVAVRKGCSYDKEVSVVVKTGNSHSGSKLPPNHLDSLEKPKKHSTTGVWFMLQARDARMGMNGLPQLSNQYLEIRDGSIPISVVKEYVMKQLHLKSEDDVEITCNGQSLAPNLSLESVQGMWFSAAPSVGVPSMKHSHSKDYMMVLTYGLTPHHKSRSSNPGL